MTEDQYNKQLASLLQRKQQNVEESRDLDKELLALREVYRNPTLQDLIEDEEIQAYCKRD